MTKESNEELIARHEEDIKIWESQEIEFTEHDINHLDDVTKEIAAFSTSNKARLYLGVDKNKNIVGVSNTDEMQNRLAGKIRSAIRQTRRSKATTLVL